MSIVVATVVATQLLRYVAELRVQMRVERGGKGGEACAVPGLAVTMTQSDQ